MEIIREFNKQVVEEKMKERGYGLVSENTTKKIVTNPLKCGQCKMEIDVKKIEVEVIVYNFAKTVDIGVCLHASVDMTTQMITLEMTELKYFAALIIRRFDFFHKDFEKIEKILYLYSRVCRDLDPHIFKLADKMDNVKNELPTGEKLPSLIKVKGQEPKEPAVPMEERKRAFWMEIMPIAKQKGLSKEFTMEFYSYWTEHGPNDRTFRKELQDKFNISKRLDTFVRNERKWSKDKTDKAAEKQDADLKTRKTTKKHEDLF